jgi:hypothetical protein
MTCRKTPWFHGSPIQHYTLGGKGFLRVPTPISLFKAELTLSKREKGRRLPGAVLLFKGVRFLWI